MPVAKLRTNTLDALKPMADNSVNTYIRQAAGNESLLSFSRNGDSPVQWFQLLNALDQQDLQGWPFMTPVKIQMQKCDKCSREFCSPINYRRHMRVHRRSLCIDKEWHKNRDLLGLFWDKLYLEKAKEVVSFDDVTLEEVPGSSILWSLTSFVRKPGYGAFPQQYVKAGSALLDIIQRPARLPITSQELFAILDDASEGTFLCAGTAESIQKFVFDGEAGKVGMEPKNLVACTSFLVEQKLVREWVADMDAESLRCQKLLVEEEEAAQRRQANLLERKKQKKLRQKEQKAKEQANGETAELEEATVLALDSPISSETTNLSLSSQSSSNLIDEPVDHLLSLSVSAEAIFFQTDADVEPQSGFTSMHSDTGPYPNIENQRALGSDRKQLNVSRWQVQKTQRARNGFHSGQDPKLSEVELVQRNHGPPRDQRPTQSVNGNKVWARKPKPEHDNGESFNAKVEKAASNRKPKSEHDNGESFNTNGEDFNTKVEKAVSTCKPKPEHDNGQTFNTKVEKAATNRISKPEQDNGLCAVTRAQEAAPTHKSESGHDIGESVNTQVKKAAPTLNYQTDLNCEVMIGSISVTLGSCNSPQQGEPPESENSAEEKHTRTDGHVGRSKVKLWRPVSRHGNGGQTSGGEFTEDIVRESNERAVLGESCQRPCSSDGNANESWNDLQEGTIQPEGFSTEAAKTFLSQRWKEAISGDHVTLVLTPEPELFDCEDAENDHHQVIKAPTDSESHAVLENAENLHENVVVFEPSINRAMKGKFKSNPEKGIKTKYIPKKKTVTRGK